MVEVTNRYKDIMFCDKDLDNIKSSKLVTRHIRLVEKLYSVFEDHVENSKISIEELQEISKEYINFIEDYGAEIRSVTRIMRSEIESPTILKNVNFSPKTIRALIEQGKRKTE